MTSATVASPGPTFSETLLASLYRHPDGERIRRCLQCGSCSGVCPFGYLMDYPPRRLIAALRAGELEQALQSDTVWLCISCYACTQVCPANIPVTALLMTRLKEELILAEKAPPELQAALANSQRYGNAMGQSPRKRADWAKGLTPPVAVLGKDKPQTDVLWYVGDYGSYHPRLQAVSRALAKIFSVLGVDFGILGPDEVSDGDSQRLAGERGLFEMLTAKNGQAFGKYRFNTIVTADPHAFNAFKNEYPALGISYPVQHYTQFLAERLDQLRPSLTKERKARVAYHDPCYLGRANGVYDAPRALLQAIPGLELVEMAHTRTMSLCCGGGGGGMWLDGFQWEKARTRTSAWRIREALAAGADILAVACPYEPPRFEDAAKGINGADGLVIKDIAELLAEAMDEPAEPTR